MELYLPKKVKLIIDKIYENKKEAFIVGGCVRDSILNKIPNDYDITTSASPQEIINIFKDYKQITTGIKHGTVGVIIDDEVFEITTYRIDKEYKDNRRPDSVEFTSNLIEDLKRRDFTVNSIAYNDEVGIVDVFNGINDIKENRIKTVGNANERFNEDALRMIRAIRFSSTLDFNIEKNTYESICENSHLVSNISIERVTEEVTKLLLGKNPENILLLKYSGVFDALNVYYFKNLLIEEKCDEKFKILKFCNSDLIDVLVMYEYLNIYEEIKELNIDMKIEHVYEILKHNLTNKLRFSKKTINTVNKLLLFMIEDIDSLNKVKIKKILNKIGEEDTIKVLNLKYIFYEKYNANRENNTNIEKMKKVIELVHEIISNNECYSIKQLKINGEDLKKEGYSGKDIGKILEALLEKVIENNNINSKKYLLNEVKNIV